MSRPANKHRRARAPQPRLITDFVPPEGVPIRFEVAGLGARLVAQLADVLISSAALVALVTVLLLSRTVSFNAVVIVGTLLFFAIRIPYYILAEILWNGRTLGKKLAGMRVISADGRSLSPHAVTVRNLMKEMEIFMPGTLLLVGSSLDRATTILLIAWILILLAVPLANRNRQRLGDILAGTYVVMLPKPVLLPDLAEPAAPMQAERYRFLPHHLDHYGRYELQTLETLLHVNSAALNRVAAARHQRNLERVAETIARRIGYDRAIGATESEQFLRAFYRTQRAYLENRKLFGDLREDKFHREDDDDGASRR